MKKLILTLAVLILHHPLCAMSAGSGHRELKQLVPNEGQSANDPSYRYFWHLISHLTNVEFHAESTQDEVRNKYYPFEEMSLLLRY